MPSRPQQLYSDGYWASCGIYMYSIMWYGQHHGLCTAPSIFSNCIQTVAGIATNPSCFSTFLYLCASPSIQWHALCCWHSPAHCLRPLVSVHSNPCPPQRGITLYLLWLAPGSMHMLLGAAASSCWYIFVGLWPRCAHFCGLYWCNFNTV